MKLSLRSAALWSIILLLAGCSAQATPSPTGPLTTPVPASPQEEVMHYVDRVLEGDEASLMCWLSSGSGPVTVNLAPYKEAVRALFAELEWKDQGDRDTIVHEKTSADWGYYLQAGDASVNFFGSTWYDSIDIAYKGLQTDGEALHFAAEGAAELAMNLVDLYPGPHIRFSLVQVPANGVNGDEELAQAYAAAFEQLYLESGDITDFDLTELNVVEKEDADSLYCFFRMAFAVTPADLSDPYWATQTADSSGQYAFDYEMHMLLDEDDRWRCDYTETLL